MILAQNELQPQEEIDENGNCGRLPTSKTRPAPLRRFSPPLDPPVHQSGGGSARSTRLDIRLCELSRHDLRIIMKPAPAPHPRVVRVGVGVPGRWARSGATGAWRRPGFITN